MVKATSRFITPVEGHYQKFDRIKFLLCEYPNNLYIRLGGNYCVRLFITTTQNVDEKFISHSKNRRIAIISCDELKNITDILKKQMNDPNFPRN